MTTERKRELQFMAIVMNIMLMYIVVFVSIPHQLTVFAGMIVVPYVVYKIKKNFYNDIL
jgi:hypothetical protein